ncbi:MAG: glycosyltransferase [Gorillibacterium sp.]|nr:glycosyltransferase [Gorillibacterium sp.]
MKKRLLFVTQYLHTGGVERSLLTLLTDLDYSKYEVDLLLFDHSGLLYKLVPPQVNILPPLFDTFTVSLPQAIPLLLKAGRLRLLAGRVLSSTLAKFSKGKGVGIRWSIYRYSLIRTWRHYDSAISYLDFFCNYYVAEKVSANKKILYNHMDYAYSESQGWPCPRLERKSFATCDYIVSVAEPARNTLAAYFPEYAGKMRVIHNQISPVTIRALSREEGYQDGFSGIRLATVARLVEEKGVLLALEACRLLVDRGLNVRWYLIGGGPLTEELKQRAAEQGIADAFVLLGEQANPYPYIASCDIYVQPSLTEAHCIAVEEALALWRPVVVTDIPSFQRQIVEGETGIHVTLHPQGLADGIERLYASAALRGELSDRLIGSGTRNSGELAKFYELIEA